MTNTRTARTTQLYKAAELTAFVTMADAVYGAGVQMATGVVTAEFHPYTAMARDLALFGVNRVKLAQMCAHASGGDLGSFLHEIVDVTAPAASQH